MQQQPFSHIPSNVSRPSSLLYTEVRPKPVALSRQFQPPLEEEQENDASFSANSADVHVHVHTPVQHNLSSLFTPSSLARIKHESCSRPNFATNLVRSAFTAEERKVSNVRGIQGKQQLDPTKIEKIKDATFQLYPLETGEKQKLAWGICIKAIDESAQRLSQRQ